MSTDSRVSDGSSVRRGSSLRLLMGLGLAGLVAVSLTFGPQIFKKQEPPEQYAHRLSKTYGIRVEFGPPSTFYTPPYTPADATAPGFEPEPATPELAGVAMAGIEAALKMYPTGFVDKLIDAVFICGKLRMDGVLAGGSAGPAWVILSAPDDLERDHIRILAEFSFHHELSSHVLRREPTTFARWGAFAPPDAVFVKSVHEAIARGERADPDPQTGFLTAYGATNPENDFNTYAEKLFTDVETLKLMAPKHPLIRRKLRFVLDAYEHLDRRLREYFVESGLESASAERDPQATVP